MQKAEKKTKDVILIEIRAHRNYLYNALLEIKLEGGGNIMTH